MIVPTCNRSAAINHLLLKSAWNFKWYGVDLVIYDSSDDDKTAAVVKNFQIDGCDNLFYEYYDGIFDGFSLDHKIISAYKKYIRKYEYIWICRDGVIITIGGCYQEITKLCDKGFDCIVVDAAFRNGNKKIIRTYERAKQAPKFFREQAIRMVTLGTLIFSSELANKFIDKYPIDNSNYSLWQMIVPFYYYQTGEMKVASVIGDVFIYNDFGTLNSFWNKAGKAFEQWVFHWQNVISKLPHIYDCEKASVLKIEMYDFHPFNLSSLIRMRANGGLNISLVNKYKQYLSSISNTSMKKYYLAALLPRFVAALMIRFEDSKIMRNIKKIYSTAYSAKERLH